MNKTDAEKLREIACWFDAESVENSDEEYYNDLRRIADSLEKQPKPNDDIDNWINQRSITADDIPELILEIRRLQAQPKPAAEPWRYDEPPKDGTRILAWFTKGLPVIVYWKKNNICTGRFNWYITNDVYFESEPNCWAAINPAEEL